MEETNVYLKNFVGTSYEVGTQIGKWALSTPDLLQRLLLPPNSYPHDKFAKIVDLLDCYCQGINEEIKGFSETIGVSSEQVLFYAMTYLERGCSLMAALPQKTENGHAVMARSFDFNNEMDEMCFAFTDIKGKYRHIGSTLNLFGRCDNLTTAIVLIIPNILFPNAVRWAHFYEMTSSMLLFGIITGFVLYITNKGNNQPV